MKELLQRHQGFWERTPAAGPLLNITSVLPESTESQPMLVPLADGSLATEGMRLVPSMLTPGKLHPDSEAPDTDLPAMAGDIFATKAPYGKVPWMEAIVGCHIRVGLASHSMWSEPALPADWHQRPLALNTDAEWREKLLDFVQYLVQNARGRYLVTHTLMRGPSDMAAALLGREEFCIALIDHPDSLEVLLDFCTDVFIETASAQLALISPFEDGYCNPFGIWAPGPCVRTQDDASALYSAQHCKRFVLPRQERIAASFDYSVVHLHSGSLHTADIYAATENIRAIQVSLDLPVGGERVQKLLPTLAWIMERKPLIVIGTFTQEELDLLLWELPTDGLCISGRVSA